MSLEVRDGGGVGGGDYGGVRVEVSEGSSKFVGEGRWRCGWR